MKTGWGLLIALSVMLTGCYNRIQEFQPYSTFDERMAAGAAEEDAKAMKYAEADVFSSDNEEMSVEFPRLKSPLPGQMARNNRNANSEVPFERVRGQQRPKPVNIGAM